MPIQLVRLAIAIGLVMAGFTMEESMAIHPDGTPVFPSKMRDMLRSGEAPPQWMDDKHLLELVAGDDLDAFTEYMQRVNAERIFYEDGSARDIREWRQAVQDDEYYTKLLRESYPEMHQVITTGTDEDVQAMLVAQHMEAARRSRYHDEL